MNLKNFNFIADGEKQAVDSLAKWAKEKNILTSVINYDLLTNPYENAEKLFSGDAHPYEVIKTYRGVVREFQPFIKKMNFRLHPAKKEEMIDQNSWLYRLCRRFQTPFLHTVVGNALHNYFCEKRNRRVEKEIPILKLFSNEGVQMIFTSFDQDHEKPYSEDAESMNFRRLKILLFEKGSSSNNAFTVINFLKNIRQFVIEDCKFNYIWGHPLQIETDFADYSDKVWRTKKSRSLKVEGHEYEISRLLDFFIKTGYFTAMPDIFHDGKELMVTMLSNGFEMKLRDELPKWKPFFDLADKSRRKKNTNK